MTPATPPAAPPPPPHPRRPPTTTKAAPGRGSFDLELSAAETVAAELARVKAERAALLASLAASRAGAARCGAALQAADTARLRGEVAVRRAALDAAVEEGARVAAAVGRRRLVVAEAAAGVAAAAAPPPSAAALVALQAKASAAEAEFVASDARARLYAALEDRTRADHAAAGAALKAAQAGRDGFGADRVAAAAFLGSARAAAAAAAAGLARRREDVEASTTAWRRRLAGRRTEVADLEREAADEVERVGRERAAAAARTAAARRARSDSDDGDAEAAAAASLRPQVEAADVAWARVRGLAGAASADGVIAHWKALQEKAGALRAEAGAAEARREAARAALAALAIAAADDEVAGVAGVAGADGLPTGPSAVEAAEAEAAAAAAAAAAAGATAARLAALTSSAKSSLRWLAGHIGAAESDGEGDEEADLAALVESVGRRLAALGGGDGVEGAPAPPPLPPSSSHPLPSHRLSRLTGDSARTAGSGRVAGRAPRPFGVAPRGGGDNRSGRRGSRASTTASGRPASGASVGADDALPCAALGDDGGLDGGVGEEEEGAGAWDGVPSREQVKHRALGLARADARAAAAAAAAAQAAAAAASAAAAKGRGGVGRR